LDRALFLEQARRRPRMRMRMRIRVPKGARRCIRHHIVMSVHVPMDEQGTKLDVHTPTTDQITTRLAQRVAL
jgi:hypothetical protein